MTLFHQTVGAVPEVYIFLTLSRIGRSVPSDASGTHRGTHLGSIVVTVLLAETYFHLSGSVNENNCHVLTSISVRSIRYEYDWWHLNYTVGLCRVGIDRRVGARPKFAL